MNKRNKKRGFTLIELIIVIAIIAILAAIAVPAFGQIRQKANVSSDLGTARTIYTLVTAAVADESILLPDPVSTDRTAFVYYKLDAVGKAPTSGTAFSALEATPGVGAPKAYQQYEYFVGLNNNGDVQIVAAAKSDTAPTANTSNDAVYTIYPKGEDRYAQ